MDTKQQLLNNKETWVNWFQQELMKESIEAISITEKNKKKSANLLREAILSGNTPNISLLKEAFKSRQTLKEMGESVLEQNDSNIIDDIFKDPFVDITDRMFGIVKESYMESASRLNAEQAFLWVVNQVNQVDKVDNISPNKINMKQLQPVGYLFYVYRETSGKVLFEYLSKKITRACINYLKPFIDFSDFSLIPKIGKAIGVLLDGLGKGEVEIETIAVDSDDVSEKAQEIKNILSRLSDLAKEDGNKKENKEDSDNDQPDIFLSDLLNKIEDELKEDEEEDKEEDQI